ncbi:MAG: gfo/Idh/MocA family oxidoreductase [Desulfobacteraceae bacterium]|jgi:predicted dehydrogenase|nr:MAG: gfo/Idh/MocA family oxidoreductase [Desulfobacteraceae bacterium]
MKKIRVGVVGVGYLGKFHAEKYSRMGDVELVGVVDPDRDQADAVAKNVGTAAFYDAADLFGNVDAVSVAAPTPLHHEIGKSFLERDIDVLIEKPITRTVEEADELIAIADSRNLILQAGHLERFNPAVVAVRKIVNHPVFIESNRLSLYKKRGTDVSVVLDLMIHDIDIIINFVKSSIRYTHAMGAPVVSDSIDIANAHIEFENGAVAKVTASRIANKNERKIRLFQKDGYISLDFANRSIVHVWPGTGGREALIPGMQIEESSFTDGDALEDEIRSFIQSVRTRQAPEVTGRMGRDALDIALAITRQIQESSRRFA